MAFKQQPATDDVAAEGGTWTPVLYERIRVLVNVPDNLLHFFVL